MGVRGVRVLCGPGYRVGNEGAERIWGALVVYRCSGGI